METLGKLFLALLLYIVGVFTIAFMLTRFWGWFLMPVFPDLRSLPFLYALGLLMIVSLFRPSNSHSDKSFTEIVGLWFGTYFGVWFLYFVGWLIHLFY